MVTTLEEFFNLPDKQQADIAQAYRHRCYVKGAYQSIMGLLEDAQGQLKDLQLNCTHPMATKKHGSNTGNWSKSDDCYWTDFSCPDCGKLWTLEGSH